ncbi:MAG: hypothetical protein A3G29_09565 [Burkholderiales bacterium RIFCSPLOWO2_12_FULL_64_99]|nr:MAG: hypothetical protein A3E52_08150 [Burkholderiales bacterium RIFCSPHIGHO2_12_FULL_63_20]OGB65067.1 MAG: hypothetical protein A3G29_09565 [Burkholderiales bacterium RIFCSPLOWO2_12_FULL_64_99]
MRCVSREGCQRSVARQCGLSLASACAIRWTFVDLFLFLFLARLLSLLGRFGCARLDIEASLSLPISRHRVEQGFFALRHRGAVLNLAGFAWVIVSQQSSTAIGAGMLTVLGSALLVVARMHLCHTSGGGGRSFCRTECGASLGPLAGFAFRVGLRGRPAGCAETQGDHRDGPDQSAVRV